MTPLLRLTTLVVAALTLAASTFAPSALTLASTAGVINPDGSETIGTVPMGEVNIPAGSPESITVDFNDLASEQVVSADRYRQLGLRLEIGPSSTTSGVIMGSLNEIPCDGTRSIKTEPFTGPSFLLRFPAGVTSVSLDVGDTGLSDSTGPSDSDVIMVKAFSDDALTTVIGIDLGLIAQGAPTVCVRLSVQAPIIKAVEITSEGYFVDSSFYPNSIFIDNVSFEPAF